MEELKEEDVTIVYYDFYDHIKGDYIRQRCIESWKRCMPKAKIICKTENTPEIKEFMESNRWCQECKKKSMYNYFVDTIRLWDSLKTENFLYLDTDVYMTKSIMPLLKEHELFAGKQTDGLWIGGEPIKTEVFQNGTVMWSRKPNEIIKKLLDTCETTPCDTNHHNCRANTDFQKTHPELLNYALSETNNYLYHFFESGITFAGNKKRLAVNFDEMDKLDNGIKNNLCMVIYNNPSGKMNSNSEKYCNRINYVGVKEMPIEEQLNFLNYLYDDKLIYYKS